MIGIMVDSARALDQRSYYRRVVDYIAENGGDTLLMHFSDDQGCAVGFDTYPECASANAYTHEQMRELCDYSRSRGVNVIPELASLGHTRYLTHNSQYAHLAETDNWYSSICPVSPESRDLIRKLLDEVLAVFDSPIVHVGLDEVNLGGHRLTKKALESQSEVEIFADYVNFLHARLSQNGRRMMMWADYVVKNPSIANLIPKDILMANWQYDPGVTPDATKILCDAGFDVVSCPALISHNQPIFPGESFAYPNVRKMAAYRDISDRVVGMITTIWTPTRFLSDTMWPGIDFAMAVMKQGPEVPVRDQVEQFGRTYFGLDDAATFATAMTQLTDTIPMRRQWLAVLGLQVKDDLPLDDRYQAFDAIARMLHSVQRQVRQNRDTYTRLLLLADLLAHVYHRAIALRDHAITSSLIAADQHFGHQLSEAWDTERFADDPRKSKPQTEFDAKDHLLINYQLGSATLRGRM